MKILHRFIILAIIGSLLFFLEKRKKASKLEVNQNKEIEVFNTDSFKINGILPLKTLKIDIKKQFGNPLKNEKVNLGEVCGTFWDKPERFIDFDGLQCETFKDSVFTKSVSFLNNKNIFLTYKAKRFTSETTYDDIKNFYPSLQASSSLDKQILVIFLICKMCDDHIVFTFMNGKLVNFQYSIPC